MAVRKAAPTYAAGPQGARLATSLLNWYLQAGRDLPWRRTRDPYQVWVSEVMLQQTRVETVIPYYRRWLEWFPTLADLAAAPEEQVLKAWEGLGYYSRARNLAAAAREVASRYGGEVPDDPEAFGKLPGVGSYTTGAVLSIAFDRELPAIDGNALRVLSRLYSIADDVGLPATRQAMERLAQELMPPGEARTFNQAVMELGALICLPARPACPSCPVAAFCRALGEGRQGVLPVKGKAKPPRTVAVVAALVRDGERILMVRRPAEGLLGGLWEFPGGESPPGLSSEQALHEVIWRKYGFRLVLEANIGSIKHAFSHLVWELTGFTAQVAPESAPPEASETLRWVTAAELSGFALPVAHQKLALLLRSTGG